MFLMMMMVKSSLFRWTSIFSKKKSCFLSSSAVWNKCLFLAAKVRIFSGKLHFFGGIFQHFFQCEKVHKFVRSSSCWGCPRRSFLEVLEIFEAVLDKGQVRDPRRHAWMSLARWQSTKVKPFTMFISIYTELQMLVITDLTFYNLDLRPTWSRQACYLIAKEKSLPQHNINRFTFSISFLTPSSGSSLWDFFSIGNTKYTSIFFLALPYHCKIFFFTI